jgi:hypothetical protein
MIKVIPNQVVCEKCMAKLEYESSDVIETITKCPNIEVEADDSTMLGYRFANGYVEVVKKHIECPVCKTKIKL